jgi:hypothetical protein
MQVRTGERPLIPSVPAALHALLGGRLRLLVTPRGGRLLDRFGCRGRRLGRGILRLRYGIRSLARCILRLGRGPLRLSRGLLRLPFRVS